MRLWLFASAVPSSSSGWDNVVRIVAKPDNVPVLALFVLFIVFTAVSLAQAVRHDRLLREGRKKEVLEAMKD